MSMNERLAIGVRVGHFPALTETFVLKQIEGLRARGHRVAVLADKPGAARDGTALRTSPHLASYVVPQNRRLARLHNWLPWRVRRAWAARIERRWCADQDVVLCHFGWSGASIADSVRGRPRRARIAVVFHGDDLSRSVVDGGPKIYDRLFDEADLLLPVSEFWLKRLLELGAPQSKIVVHHMGIDVDWFAMRPPRSAPSRPFRLVSVGRLVAKKGTAVTLRALALLRDRDPDLAVTLDIIGSGPLAAPLEALADELALRDIVTFHGARPSEFVQRTMVDADAFVLSSLTAPDGDMEGVPVAIMEAMGSGIPVVSTQHSGIPELIEDGCNGLLAAEGSVESLADRLRALIDDPDAAARYVAAARRTIEANFDNRGLNDRLSELLTRLVHSGVVLSTPTGAEPG